MSVLDGFIDPDLESWTDAGQAAESVAAPAEVPAYVPESTDPLFTFKSTVDQLWSRYSTGTDPAAPAFRNLADTSVPGTDVKGGGPKSADDGGSVFKSIAKFMGFSDTAEGRNASAAMLAGGVGAFVKGAVGGILDSKVREAQVRRSGAETDLATAQAAAVRAKSHQDLSSLNVNTPGILGGFKPATLVPVKARV